jgi:hypothetical protein
MKKRFFIIAFACLVLAACSDQRYASFGTGIDAQQSLEAKQGWIPDWFPITAKEIQVQYDVDSYCRWFSFKLDEDGKRALIKPFRLLSPAEARAVNAPRPRQAADWWLKGLGQAQPADGAPLNADIYLRNQGKMPEKAYLVISKTDDSVFLWIEKGSLQHER